jgi:ParB family transcriptional regulator, chromosome partitioning protein
MTKKRRFGVSSALSRGLSETIHVVENNSGMFRNVVLPLSRVELDPDNPRKLAITLNDVREGFNKQDPSYPQKAAELESLKELAATIESSGVINPIVVYKRGEHYRVVAGERRCLASILANKKEIDARVYNEKPKGFELKLVQWIENTAREDLTLDERIENVRDLVKEYQKQNGATALTATLLKEITGLSLPQATYYLAVLNAPSDLKQAIVTAKIRSLDKAALLAGIESDSLRQQALEACIEGCSLKELRLVISQQKEFVKKQKQVTAEAKIRKVLGSRVQMGSTNHTVVVKEIIQCVLGQGKYKKYEAIFSATDWAHNKHAALAFRQLVEILEREIVG